VTRVLITGARAPIALDLARSFEAAGCEPHLADSVTPLSVLASGRGARFHRLAAPRRDFAAFAAEVERLVERLDPRLIVPTSEEVFYLAEAARLGGFAERLFAPPMTLLRRLHSKAEFPGLVAEAGLASPATRRIVEPSELPADGAGLVLKPEFSRFAERVLVEPGPAALSRLRPSPDAPWVAQARVEGEELCLWSAAIGGRLAAVAAYRPLWRLPGSASFCFEAVEAADLTEFAARMAAHTGVTGQLSYDLIRTAEGRLLPIECNPRGISAIHLFGGDAALAEALLGKTSARVGPGVEIACLGPAMALFGPAQARREGRRDAFRHDRARAREALSADGREPLVPAAALADYGRFVLAGALAGRSATAQGTWDIEWNGEGFIERLAPKL
jgi:hypothetical protein